MFGCLQNFLLDMLKVLLMLRSTALGLKKITVAFLVFKRSLRFTQSQTFTLAVGTRLRLLEQDSELAMLIFMSFLSSWDAVLLLPKKMGTTLVQQDKLCGEAALCEDVQKLLSGLSKCRVQHRMARPAGTSKIIRYLRRQASRQR